MAGKSRICLECKNRAICTIYMAIDHELESLIQTVEHCYSMQAFDRVRKEETVNHIRFEVLRAIAKSCKYFA